MGTLTEDLDRYWDEAYTNKDIIAGLKLIAEFAGLVGLAVTAFVGGSIVLSWILGPFGIPVSGGAVFHIIVKPLLEWYDKLETRQRFYVRAAINAFNPAQHLEMATGAVSQMEEVTMLIEVIRKALNVQKKASKAANVLDKASKAVKTFFKGEG